MMIKKNEAVDFFNAFLRNAQAKGEYKRQTPRTDTWFRRQIRAGSVPDREYYSPSDIAQWFLSRRWSPRASRDSDRIHELRRLGKKTIKETADERGCSESTVKRRFSDKGSLLGLIGKKNHRYAIIQTLFEDGWTKQEIMEEVGVRDRTIRRALKE